MALTFTAASSQWLSKASALVTAEPLTFAAWINISSFASSYGIIGIGTTTSSNGWHMYTSASAELFVEAINGAAANTASAMSTSTWHHVAGVFASNASRSAYVDGGGKVTNTTFGSVTGLTTTYVGNIYEGGNFPMNGTIAYPAIWNIALSDSDISELAAGASPLKVHPEALVAYVPLLDTTGDDDISATAWTKNGSPTLATINPPIYLP